VGAVRRVSLWLLDARADDPKNTLGAVAAGGEAQLTSIPDKAVCQIALGVLAGLKRARASC
jgi:hypothetical protein